MIISDEFEEGQESSRKLYHSTHLTLPKFDEIPPLGPWEPSIRVSPHAILPHQRSFGKVLNKKYSLNQSTSPQREFFPGKSMFILSKINTKVVGYFDQQKLGKCKQENSSKHCVIRSLKPQCVFPRRVSQGLKSPMEPTFVSQFKYKQNKINKKIMTSFEEESKLNRSQRVTTMPSICKYLECRKGKVMSLGFQKILSQRLQHEMSAIEAHVAGKSRRN